MRKKCLHCCDDYAFAAEQRNYVIEDIASQIAFFSQKYKRSTKKETKEDLKDTKNSGILNFNFRVVKLYPFISSPTILPIHIYL